MMTFQTRPKEGKTYEVLILTKGGCQFFPGSVTIVISPDTDPKAGQFKSFKKTWFDFVFVIVFWTFKFCAKIHPPSNDSKQALIPFIIPENIKIKVGYQDHVKHAIISMCDDSYQSRLHIKHGNYFSSFIRTTLSASSHARRSFRSRLLLLLLTS